MLPWKLKREDGLWKKKREIEAKTEKGREFRHFERRRPRNQPQRGRGGFDAPGLNSSVPAPRGRATKGSPARRPNGPHPAGKEGKKVASGGNHILKNPLPTKKKKNPPGRPNPKFPPPTQAQKKKKQNAPPQKNNNSLPSKKKIKWQTSG